MNWDWSSFLIGVGAMLALLGMVCIVVEDTKPDLIETDYTNKSKNKRTSKTEANVSDLSVKLDGIRSMLIVLDSRTSYMNKCMVENEYEKNKNKNTYRVTIVRKNSMYDSYSFTWDDEQLEQHKDNITKLIVKERSHISLYDKEKEIFIRDNDIENIVVAREDGV